MKYLSTKGAKYLVQVVLVVLLAAQAACKKTTTTEVVVDAYKELNPEVKYSGGGL